MFKGGVNSGFVERGCGGREGGDIRRRVSWSEEVDWEGEKSKGRSSSPASRERVKPVGKVTISTPSGSG